MVHCIIRRRLSSLNIRSFAMHNHDTHPALIKRLRCCGGHLASVVKMLEEGRPRLGGPQLQAVEKAITQAKRPLIQDHLDHCWAHMVDA